MLFYSHTGDLPLQVCYCPTQTIVNNLRWQRYVFPKIIRKEKHTPPPTVFSPAHSKLRCYATAPVETNANFSRNPELFAAHVEAFFNTHTDKYTHTHTQSGADVRKYV